LARRLQMTPLRRAGTVEEVAGAVVWLASAAGAFVTGQNIAIDGGTVITDGS
jgi:NAD(P)-dependent dehydrogenase (short-subunit alcohol dehydrogenase family)